MKVEIVTPETIAYSEIADQITIPTADGHITVLPGHTSLVTKLLAGELTLKKGSQITTLAIGSGFAEISGKKVSIVTDLAQRPGEIDERAAEEARKRAQQALDDRQRLSEEEYALTVATLEKSLAQLKVKRRHSRRPPLTNNRFLVR